MLVFMWLFTVAWTISVDYHQEDRLDIHRQYIKELRETDDKIWQDLQFTDYDHRVDLCQLRHRDSQYLKERCVIAAYRKYCETSRQCVARRRGR